MFFNPLCPAMLSTSGLLGTLEVFLAVNASGRTPVNFRMGPDPRVCMRHGYMCSTILVELWNIGILHPLDPRGLFYMPFWFCLLYRKRGAAMEVLGTARYLNTEILYWFL